MRLCILVLSCGMLASCVSIGKKEADPPPAIVDNMPLDQALNAALDYGDQTAKQVRKLLKKRHELAAADTMLQGKLTKDLSQFDNAQLINAVQLYQFTDPKHPELVFTHLVDSDRKLARQLAWYVASALPSAPMRSAIEARLTDALSNDELEEVFLPKMAEAVANNQMTSSYTLIRQGLFVVHNVSFVRAMIALDPHRASVDFMDYLALAPLEELRQLNLRAIDLFSCTVIMEHFLSVPVASSHRHFEHLFFFAISRNNALAELAQKVLEGYLPDQGETLALSLAQQPAWVQIAFIEGARRRMSAVLGLFLGELKKVTAQNDVIDELNNLRL